MPKSNFNHFLNECDHFESIGTFNKNKSKLSFEQGTKSNTNADSNMFLNARNDSMSTAEKVVATLPSPSIIELNSELAFPSLMSSSASSTSSSITAPKKFKNFKDAISSVPSPKKQKQVKELKPLVPIEQTHTVSKRPPPPLLVKKESEVFARIVLAKTKNMADNIDEYDDDYDADDKNDNKKHNKNNKTYYEDDSDCDY